VNSAWSYASKERADTAENDIKFLLNFVSLKGLYPEDLESMKVERAGNGFTGNIIFKSYASYQNYETAMASFPFSFEGIW